MVYQRYHDEEVRSTYVLSFCVSPFLPPSSLSRSRSYSCSIEWGELRAGQDDRYFFEMLCLEGFQAGLSWITILKKRENFRKAFDQFDIDTVSNKHRYRTIPCQQSVRPPLETLLLIHHITLPGVLL